ncbi:PTS sugar transporter subunit IIA [Haloprofundus halobius]|uniref:PTS sugar transporter subunit IIA n=1 Tax=Haloprofundus halobius TaxID=2876194 RepID=UPI001CCD735D|nr:fructose PTS transporter subunit IIA [Haloprofundus halobius]
MDPNDIDRLMPTELISLNDPPTEKEACIEYLLDVVADAGRVDDRDGALAALYQREEETTTGVGKGIGIPHAKTDAISRPSVAFTRSEAGVDFESMDDEPAHLVFMILVPESGSDEHLAVLSSLSRSLMHDEVREALYDAETPADVQSVMKEAMA